MGLLLGERDLEDGYFRRLPFEWHFNLLHCIYFFGCWNFSWDLAHSRVSYLTCLDRFNGLILVELRFPTSFSRTLPSFTPRISRSRRRDLRSVPKPHVSESFIHELLCKYQAVHPTTVHVKRQHTFLKSLFVPVHNALRTFGVPGRSSECLKNYPIIPSVVHVHPFFANNI